MAVTSDQNKMTLPHEDLMFELRFCTFGRQLRNPSDANDMGNEMDQPRRQIENLNSYSNQKHFLGSFSN